MIEKNCEHCKAPFTGRRQARFCSDHCRWLAHKAAQVSNRRPLSGKGCKDKGARVEREVCAKIKEITGDEVQRKLGQARDGGADVDWGPFRLEVKARETIAMPAWQDQVLRACEGTDMVPSVVWKRRGEEFWIACPFSAFLSMFHAMRTALEALSSAERQPK